MNEKDLRETTWLSYTIRDDGGFIYTTDEKMLERWSGESDEHCLLRDGADWRPVKI